MQVEPRLIHRFFCVGALFNCVPARSQTKVFLLGRRFHWTKDFGWATKDTRKPYLFLEGEFFMEVA